MADTFTGLKLQGQIGKFGNVELSDVAAFVELPDGKVLSGAETGELLMWDGGLIKVCRGHTGCRGLSATGWRGAQKTRELVMWDGGLIKVCGGHRHSMWLP